VNRDTASDAQSLAIATVTNRAKTREVIQGGGQASGRIFAAARRERCRDGSRTKNLAEKIDALREKRGRYGVLLTELERSGESQISLTDPDSRVVADRGYFKIEDIEACEKAGMTPYVPKPQRGSSVSNGFFRKDEFRYDAERATPSSVRPARSCRRAMKASCGN
jgi:hypothetical protein